MKKYFANIFQFTKRERIGVIALAVLLVLLIVANQFLYLLIPEKKYDYSQYEHLVMKEPSVASYNENNKQPEDAVKPNKPYKPDTLAKNQGKTTIKVIELNTADSLSLVSLNGIGPAFASRIIKYRKILGGYVKKEQLLEVYGFDKEKYDLVKPFVWVTPNPIKINLNTCTFKELNKHPYINYDLTKAIFNLKKRLGKFRSVDDIKQIDLVNDEMYNKLAPYLTTQ